MTPYKVYICGAITGKETIAAKEFESAKNKIIAMGMIPVNPFDLEHGDASQWHEFMKTDIKALMDCDYIYICNDITNSTGANIELELARDLGIKEATILLP